MNIYFIVFYRSKVKAKHTVTLAKRLHLPVPFPIQSYSVDPD